MTRIADRHELWEGAAFMIKAQWNMAIDSMMQRSFWKWKCGWYPYSRFSRRKARKANPVFPPPLLTLVDLEQRPTYHREVSIQIRSIHLLLNMVLNEGFASRSFFSLFLLSLFSGSFFCSNNNEAFPPFRNAYRGVAVTGASALGTKHNNHPLFLFLIWIRSC